MYLCAACADNVSGYDALKPLFFVQASEHRENVLIRFLNLNLKVRNSQSLRLQRHYWKAVKNIRLQVNIREKIGNFVTLSYHLVIRQAALFATAPVDDDFHSTTP